jgi:hypothetical protein
VEEERKREKVEGRLDIGRRCPPRGSLRARQGPPPPCPCPRKSWPRSRAHSPRWSGRGRPRRTAAASSGPLRHRQRREERRGEEREIVVWCGVIWGDMVWWEQPPTAVVATAVLGADRGGEQTSGGRRLEVLAEHQRCRWASPGTPTQQDDTIERRRHGQPDESERSRQSHYRIASHLRCPAGGWQWPPSCALPTPAMHLTSLGHRHGSRPDTGGGGGGELYHEGRDWVRATFRTHPQGQVVDFNLTSEESG